MTGQILRAIFLFGAILFSRLPAEAQGLEAAPNRRRNDPQASLIFDDIQAAVKSGDLNPLSPDLARQVYLNLPGVEGGFFSENQALYILKDYFKSRRVLSFRLSTVSTVEGTPYATGGGTYLQRGVQELLQVYVALKKSGDRWVIAQFSVY
jgi:hypothetical protein